MDPAELPGVSSSAQEDTEDLSIPRAAINKMIKGENCLNRKRASPDVFAYVRI